MKPIKNILNTLRIHLFFIVAAAVTVIVMILIAFSVFREPTRASTYKQVSGSGAGLQASITYGASCNQNSCHTKPSFDFNVYILKEDGQQASVVRPDKDGSVNLALPGGDYVMIIGKQFGKDKIFPQELLKLKNGQQLELKLHYE